ncbi:MAG: hypothetical protein WCG25_07685 [bacterium]
MHLARVFPACADKCFLGACPAKREGDAKKEISEGFYIFFFIASPAGRFFFAPRSKNKPKNPSSIVFFMFVDN